MTMRSTGTKKFQFKDCKDLDFKLVTSAILDSEIEKIKKIRESEIAPEGTVVINFGQGELLALLGEEAFSRGNLQVAKQFLLSAVNIYIEKLNFNNAFNLILKLESKFPHEFWFLIKLEMLLKQKDFKKIDLICAEFIKSNLMLSRVNEILKKKLKILINFFNMQLSSVFSLNYIQLKLLSYSEYQNVVSTERKKIITQTLFKEIINGILLSPDDVNIYKRAIEILTKQNDENVTNLINYVEREFAIDALKKGGELFNFLKKHKKTTSKRSQDEVISFDEIIFDLGSDDTEKTDSVKVTSEKEVLLRNIIELKESGKSSQALSLIQEYQNKYSTDSLVNAIKVELLDLTNNMKVHTNELSFVNREDLILKSKIDDEAVSKLKTQLNWIILNDEKLVNEISPEDICMMLFNMEMFETLVNYLDRKIIKEEIKVESEDSQVLSLYYVKIVALIELGRYFEAKNLVEQVNNIFPTNTNESIAFLFLEAQICFLLNKADEAKRILAEILSYRKNIKIYNGNKEQ